jgi:hypothetical protein
LAVPPRIRRQARLKVGDQLEFKATPGMITIVSKPPRATGEYTPEQRRMIDARLTKALEEVDTGRTYGPFESHEAMMAFLNRRLTPAADDSYAAAPDRIKNAFDKQARLLVDKPRHPSLRTKKFDEARDIWQARVTKDWRF